MVLPLGDDNSLRRTTPIITYALIAVNALVWFLQLSSGEPFTNGYSTVPFEITHGVDLVGIHNVVAGGQTFPIHLYAGPHPIYLTLITAMFMHGSWMHIIGNMLYLWIFGDNIEDLLGHWRYLGFYLACGIAASLAQVFYGPGSYVPSLGASGAIAGVLGAYLIKHPKNPVRVLLGRIITTLPAFVVLGFWIVLQIFSQVASPAGEASGV
ncbi:MAG: rhomboid family intramembrane serine protease, partial [Gemmatimonadota bacterium]